MQRAIGFICLAFFSAAKIHATNSYVRQPSRLCVRVTRPRVQEKLPDYEKFANSPEEYLELAGLVYFNVCDCRFEAVPNLTFLWKITSITKSEISSLNSLKNNSLDSDVMTINITRTCQFSWRTQSQGEYFVSVQALLPNNQTFATGSCKFFVRDIWIVVLGDSFASGQGNPDSPMFDTIPPRWISNKCFRSGKGSWAYQVYQLLERQFPDYGILFTYLPCGGATIQHGLLGRMPVGQGQSLPAQVNIVESIKAAATEHWCRCTECRGCHTQSKPDLLFLTIGGNDIQFSEIVYSILGSGSPPFIFQHMSGFLRHFERDLDTLASILSTSLAMPDGAIFFLQYFDMLRNDNGIVDASCPGLHAATTEAFLRADQEVLQPLNAIISQTKNRYNWTVVEGVAQLFYQHGICSKKPFVRTLQESLHLQGNYYGAFHPNAQGQIKVAKHVWNKYVKQYLNIAVSSTSGTYTACSHSSVMT